MGIDEIGGIFKVAEAVTIFGLMLLIIIVLGFVVRYLVNRCDEREKEHNDEIKAKDEEIKGYIKDYYTMQEKTLMILEIKKKSSDV